MINSLSPARLTKALQKRGKPAKFVTGFEADQARSDFEKPPENLSGIYEEASEDPISRIEKRLAASKLHGFTNLSVGETPEEKRVRNAKRSLTKQWLDKTITTGQVIYPAEPEDIELLSKSKALYPHPLQVENSTIVRIVRLSDAVISPVRRVFHNMQPGLRGNEYWKIMGVGIFLAGTTLSLGFWQLRRMDWKRELIEIRKHRLSLPRTFVRESVFPWTSDMKNWEYRCVEVKGVFDHTREQYIGPRPGGDPASDDRITCGFLVVTPLILEDGSTLLVNRGMVRQRDLKRESRPEPVEVVRVRGVLETDEIPSLSSVRIKNRPQDNTYSWLKSQDLAANVEAVNHEECGTALLTAYDWIYEDEKDSRNVMLLQSQLDGPIDQSLLPSERVQELTQMRQACKLVMRPRKDYLVFWADESVHFSYACQWFGMSAMFSGMTLYKMVQLLRWRF